MSVSHAKDRPILEAKSFSASLIETAGLRHSLTVSGEAVGDYRIGDVRLVRSHQSTAHLLVLDVTAKLGPVENPHPDIEKTIPVHYTEQPAEHDYAEVKIVNGSQHFTVRVVAAL